MRKIKLASALMVMVTAMLIVGSVQAAIQGIYFDGRTTTTGTNDNKRIDFYLEVKDNRIDYIPPYIKSITITAPNGKTFTLDPKLDYMPFDKGYYADAYPSDFADNKIPSGTWSIAVTDTSGKVWKANDYISASFLAVPIISNPIANSSITAGALTVKWGVVTGAEVYRLYLYNDSWDEPVYLFDNTVVTQNTSFYIPVAVLKPGCNYRLRIDARTTILDVDKRSRTNWLVFSTN